VPKLGEIPPEVQIGNGESVTLTFDTVSDIGLIHGERGTRYAFPVRLSDGRTAVLKGGKRLLSAIQEAVGTRQGNLTLKVTARGNAGSLDRTYHCETVG